MKVNYIEITGVAGVEFIHIDFNESANIICGPNGIGKTTVLESVSHILSNGQSQILKRNVKSDRSKITVSINELGMERKQTAEFDTFRPEMTAQISGMHEFSKKVLSFKITRTFNYVPIQAVGRDADKQQYIMWQEAFNGISLSDIKNWFVNRYLYSAHVGALSKEQLDNFILAKKCFSILDQRFSFSKVDASTNEILINTPSGEIYYEYLSSGFKSIISLLFGIIKEIELRFKEPRIKAFEFDGVILIDELELHLHPAWQGKIVSVITTVFPMAQIIATTHSPHIIQASEPNQIIVLAHDENLKVINKELPLNEYGFKGWTIEEVLTDVMGMYDLRTAIFNELMEKFQKSVEENDIEKANRVYNEVNSMLHPQNRIRKLLKFQLIGMGSNEYD